MKIDEQSYQELLNRLLSLSANLQLYHWQTTSYARHLASGDLYDILSEKTDEFIELFISRTRRPYIHENNKLIIYNFNTKTIVQYLKEYIQYFTLIDKHIPQLAKWTDLLNVRDEIVGEIQRTLYRFTLV